MCRRFGWDASGDRGIGRVSKAPVLGFKLSFGGTLEFTLKIPTQLQAIEALIWVRVGHQFS